MKEESVKGFTRWRSRRKRVRNCTYDGDVLRGQHLYVSTVPFIGCEFQDNWEQSGNDHGRCAFQRVSVRRG